MISPRRAPEGEGEESKVSSRPTEEQREQESDVRRARAARRDEFLAAVGLKKITSELQAGGPAVDFPLLVDYIDSALDAAAAERVGRYIVTFRAWYDAYWETVGAMDIVKELSEE